MKDVTLHDYLRETCRDLCRLYNDLPEGSLKERLAEAQMDLATLGHCDDAKQTAMPPITRHERLAA